jgi:putative transposase
MKKIPPSVGLRKQISEYVDNLHGVDNGSQALSELVKMASELIIQQGLESEQQDFIGQRHYERGPRVGYRSGYEPGYLDTAEGRLSVSLPQVRDAGQPYRSKLYEFLRGDSEMVKRLAVEMYARGLSTRDIEDAFTDEMGNRLLSQPAVCEVTEVLWDEYQAFQKRDLSNLEVLYLFVDALYEPLRVHGIDKEAILCAWAITMDGRKVLVGLDLGNVESFDAWLAFLRDLVERGLPTPLSITSDGAPGLLQAINQVWAKSLRLRCWVHRMRNFQTKVPPQRWPEIKAHLVALRDAPNLEVGQQIATDVIARFQNELPGLCKALSDDLEALLAHLNLPPAHRKYVRTTNLIERSFVEERRRTKIIPRFFTEKSCLKLVFATLDRAAARWQRVRITPLEYEQIKLIYKQQGIAQPEYLNAVA